jgi:hypothetical protein
MTPNSSVGGDRRQVIWLVVTSAFVCGLTGVNLYRAATQSITHDEAVTYERFVSGPLYRLVSSTDANNHILHSLLCRATVGVCGPSELALRLPSLAGGFLFLTMIASVGRRVWGWSPTTAAAVLVLGSNPFVMDYLSIARGYSLALGLWVAALDQFLAAWSAAVGRNHPPAEPPAGRSDLHVRRAAQLLALCVLANLTFVVAAVALAACWAAWVWRIRRRDDSETPRQSLAWLWRTLIRPGVVVFICLAAPLLKLRPRHFYFGADNLTQSLRGFVDASLAHHPQTWPWDNRAPGFRSCLDVIALGIVPAVAVLLLALWAFAAHRFWRRGADRSNRALPGELLFHLSAGTFCLSLALLLLLHAGAGLKLPLERTGLYLLPPFCLAILSAASALGAIARSRAGRSALVLPASVLRGAATLGALLLCVVWGGQLQVDHYRPWAFESDSRTVFRQIVSQHDGRSKQRLRVGATWVLVPALNFYRDVFKADFVERIERRVRYPEDADLYVFALGEEGAAPPDEPFVELYRGAASGAVVARPTRRPTSSPRSAAPSPPGSRLVPQAD